MTAAASHRRQNKTRQGRRDVTISFRATEAWRTLIDQAASLTEKTRTEFIIDATRRQAEDVLLDQKFFALNADGCRAFSNILVNPPAPNEELIKLMRQEAPWHKP